MSLLKIASSLLVASALLAQQKPAETKPELEAAIIPVKTLNGDSFERLVRLLNVFQARFTADEKLRTIVVYAPKDVVDQMKRVIDELDRPGSEAAIGRNIDLTLTMLRCSTKAPAEGVAPLPDDLEAVAKQLRAATQYKYVELWDIVPMRIQEGKQTEQSARLPNTAIRAKMPGSAFATAQIKVQPTSVTRKDSGRYVRFDRLNIGFRIPYVTGGSPDPGAMVSPQYQFMEVGLNTSGDFKEGQKSVIGKVSGLDDESAVFVVVALKVLD